MKLLVVFLVINFFFVDLSNKIVAHFNSFFLLFHPFFRDLSMNLFFLHFLMNLSDILLDQTIDSITNWIVRMRCLWFCNKISWLTSIWAALVLHFMLVKAYVPVMHGLILNILILVFAFFLGIDGVRKILLWQGLVVEIRGVLVWMIYTLRCYTSYLITLNERTFIWSWICHILTCSLSWIQKFLTTSFSNVFWELNLKILNNLCKIQIIISLFSLFRSWFWPFIFLFWLLFLFILKILFQADTKSPTLNNWFIFLFQNFIGGSVFKID